MSNATREAEIAFMQKLVDSGLADPIVTENSGFDTESATEPWYTSRSNPGFPTRPGIGAEGVSRFVGLFEMQVVWPRGRGDGVAKERADEIAALFPVGSVLGDAVVTRSHRLPGIIMDAKWYVVPVQVAYRVDQGE